MKRLIILFFFLSIALSAQTTKYTLKLDGSLADSMFIGKGKPLQWDNTAHKYFYRYNGVKYYFGGSSIDTTKISFLAKNNIFTGVNQFNNSQTYFNSLLYQFPSTGRIPGSVLYDSLGDGVYKFRKMQPYINIKYPLKRSGDSILIDYNSILLRVYSNKLDLNPLGAPTFAGFTAINGNIPQVGNYGFSNNFTSGINGTGFNLYKDATGTNLEVDNIMVRNTLRTSIFQKDMVKAVDGILYVSSSGVISSINSGGNQVGFDYEKSAAFNSSDTLWVKDYDDSGTIISVKFVIGGTAGGSGETIYNVTPILGSLSSLKAGMTAARISGGRVVIDAASANTPYIDIWSGSVLKGRYGNLAGIYDVDFGSLTGYGIYSTNGFFKGLIRGSSIRSSNYETSDRTNTALSSIFIDGSNNALEFRAAGRSNATDYKVKITSNVQPGTFDLPGVRLIDAIFLTTSGNNYAAINPNGSSIYFSNTGGLSAPGLRSDVVGSTFDNFGLVGTASGVGHNQYGITAQANQNGNSGAAYGGYFTGIGYSGSTVAYGVYAHANGGAANYGLYATTGGTGYAGYFDVGNVYIKNQLEIGSSKFIVNSSGQLTTVNNLSATNKYALMGDGSQFTPRQIVYSDLSALTASRILISDVSGYPTASSISSSELFTPQYGSMGEIDGTTGISTNGAWNKWYMSTARNLKGVTHSTSSDCLTINSAGVYEVGYAVSFYADGDKIIWWGIAVNGTIDDYSRTKTDVLSGKYYSVSKIVQMSLSANDEIDLRTIASTQTYVTANQTIVYVRKISN